jgi:hypothetical protein
VTTDTAGVGNVLVCWHSVNHAPIRVGGPPLGTLARVLRPRSDALERPHPSRLDPARPDVELVLARHARAVADGQPGYLDPGTGLFVLTAAELLRRGWCCDRGCRHCPWVGGPDTAGTPPDSPA